jgi:hypothetical protein
MGRRKGKEKREIIKRKKEKETGKREGEKREE